MTASISDFIKWVCTISFRQSRGIFGSYKFYYVSHIICCMENEEKLCSMSLRSSGGLLLAAVGIGPCSFWHYCA